MEFPPEQLKQFSSLLNLHIAQLESRLSSCLEGIDNLQGNLWESAVRPLVRKQHGHSFSKEFSIVSLQYLAKLICHSTGWTLGSEPVDICLVAAQFVTRLLVDHVAERLVRAVFEALTRLQDGAYVFSDLGRHIGSDPWFDADDKINIQAFGRSLSKLGDADSDSSREHNSRQQVRSKLSLLHLLFTHSGNDASQVDTAQDSQACVLVCNMCAQQKVAVGKVTPCGQLGDGTASFAPF